VTPEEYSALSQFVDRVERGILSQRQTERKAEKDKRDAVLATIPPMAFEMPVEDLAIPDRLHALLVEAGYITIGDVLLQLRLDADAILGLNGVGPKSMQELEEALAAISFPEAPVLEEEAVPEAELAPLEGVVAEAIEEEAEAEGEVPVEAAAPEIEEVELAAEAGVEPGVEAVAEPIAEEVTEVIEPVIIPEIVEEVPAEAIPVELEAAETKEEELPTSLDELFTLKPEVFDVEVVDEEEEEETGDRKKKKQKKKKYVEMEYDPDKDAMIVKRKRKRDGSDWENWNY
jgi:N utilization substance protein A